MFIDYNDYFDFLETIKYKTNEYYLKGNKIGAVKEKIPVGAFNTISLENLTHDVIRKVKEKEGQNVWVETIVVDDRAIKRFHPNTINNKDFWVKARKHFPLLSICGKPSKNKKEANFTTLGMHEYLGALDFVNNQIIKSENNLEFLEIGFGYGNVFQLFKDHLNYTGIDYIVPR